MRCRFKEKIMQYFRNNQEMMSFLRGKMEKLEPKAVREAKKEEEKPKKARKRRKKVEEDVDKAE